MSLAKNDVGSFEFSTIPTHKTKKTSSTARAFASYVLLAKRKQCQSQKINTLGRSEKTMPKSTKLVFYLLGFC